MLTALALAAPLGAQQSTAPEAQATAAAAGREPSQSAAPDAASGANQGANQGADQGKAAGKDQGEEQKSEPNAINDATQNAAQDASQSQPALPDEPAVTRDQAEQPKKPSKGQESHERIMGVVPNYGVVNNASTARALTPGEKFRLFARETYDPFHFVSIGIASAFDLARDDLPEYGQDAEGYGQRYGTNFADSTIGGFFGTYLLPTLFHEDPRYFRQGTGTIRSRLLHAAKASVIVRRDDGTNSLNYANFLSGFLASSIGNAYYPEQQRGADITFSRGARHLPGKSINAIFQEFWPDVHDKIFKKHKLMQSTTGRSTTSQSPASPSH